MSTKNLSFCENAQNIGGGGGGRGWGVRVDVNEVCVKMPNKSGLGVRSGEGGCLGGGGGW